MPVTLPPARFPVHRSPLRVPLPRASRLLAALAVVLAAATARAARAQDSTRADTVTPKRADGTALPLEPTRPLRFSTDEGTWMSVDVSPDGRTIVFDLLGDLYTLPIAGGTATRITSGPGFDAQPRWSPDGRLIAFTSDRDGSQNLWVVDADGKHPRQLSKVEKTQFVSPDWTPDGKYVIVSRNAALFGTLYDLWLYHVDGGSGVKMTGTAPVPAGPPAPGTTPAPNNYMGAAFGKDARYVYAAVRTGAGGYNQTSFGWQVAVYDRETGKTWARTSALGGAMRPTPSPDGKWLVYATRDDSVTALRLRELATGDERVLVPHAQRDDQESRFTRDLMPGMSFTPDGRALVVFNGGKLWRVAVPSGEATPIPFRADVDVALGPQVKFEYTINDSTLTVRQIRGARPSPDGRRLVFTALDKLWVLDLAACRAGADTAEARAPGARSAERRRECTPRRLTTSARSLGEHDPAWSPDGRWVAYVTWTEQGGDVMRVRVSDAGRAAGAPQRLSRARAFYEMPAFTPDGARVVVARGPRQPRIELDEFEPGDPAAAGVELVWLPASGGDMTVITPLGRYGQPHFTRDGERVYVYEPQEGLVSMRFDGTDRRTIVKVTGYVDARSATPRPTPADEVLVSPDGDRALVAADNNVYVIDIPVVGGPAPTVSVAAPDKATVPVHRLTRIGGDFIGWYPDGKRVHYSIGHAYFAYDLARADSVRRDSTARADSLKRLGVKPPAPKDSAGAAVGVRRPAAPVRLTPADSARVAAADTGKTAKPLYEPERTDVVITVPRDRPRGVIALRNARLVTMRGDEVIERGDIVVRDNRIVGVGASGTVPIPADAHVVDVAGKTIIPGWVDIHAHIWPSWGIHRTQVWEYLVNLAYGVTTTRDPQTSTTDVLAYGDLVETGDILGPRIFTTGPGVFWSDDIRSLADARDVLRRYADYYDTHTIKQYMVGDRKVRQWVIMAARELGLMPTLEGGLDFAKNLTEVMDGYPGTEHTYPIAPLHDDVVKLVAESGTTYTPTLLVQYGGPWAENYWYEHYDITTDPKVNRFTPRSEVLRRGLRRPQWFHDSQYAFPFMARQLTKIVQAGGHVGLGGHGQMQGLGVHWELWSIASGGMKPHDVLRVGTITGAEAIGLGRELGSLERGKLADLQVLDANPLADIHNTNTVRYVMKNGRLYDASTLDELWPEQRALPTQWWQEQR